MLREADLHLPKAGWGWIVLSASASRAGRAWTDEGTARQGPHAAALHRSAAARGVPRASRDPRRPGLLESSGVALDPRGNVAADTERYATSLPKVFTAGDMRRGQSLVVWAIREGRQCARAVDALLMGESTLPR